MEVSVLCVRSNEWFLPNHKFVSICLVNAVENETIFITSEAVLQRSLELFVFFLWLEQLQLLFVYVCLALAKRIRSP